MKLQKACLLILFVGIAGCSQTMKKIDYPVPPAFPKKVVDYSTPEFRLLVFTESYPVTLPSPKELAGWPIYVAVLNRQGREVSVYASCIDFDSAVVDYSHFDEGLLVIDECVWDPRLEEPLGIDPQPLFQLSLRFDKQQLLKEEIHIMAYPEEGGPSRMALLRREFLSVLRRLEDGQNSKCDQEAFLTPLAHLRNMAINDPDAVLSLLAGVQMKGLATSHWFSGIEDQIKKIRDVKTNNVSKWSTKPTAVRN